MPFTASNAIVFIICTVGLVYQVIDVCDSYFSYGTKSLIVMQLPLRIDMPGLSVCFRIEKILKRDQIQADKNILVPVAVKNWTAYYLEINKLSVKEMFHFTPSVNEVLSKNTTACMIRYPGRFAVNYPYAKADECYSLLNITKYIQRQFMCYRFHVNIDALTKKKEAEGNQVDKYAGSDEDDNRKRTEDTLLIDESCLTPNLPGLIYNVWLDNDMFGDVNLLSAFAHGDNTCPLFDSIFAASVDFNYVGNNLFVGLQITPRSIAISRLPPPYDTKCNHYHPFSSRYQKILNSVRLASIRKLNLVPTLDHVYADYDFPFLSPYHVRNLTLASQLRNIVNKNYVDDPECDISYYVTDTKSSLGSNVKVSVIWPQDISLSINYKPDKVFLDLIIYISSCVGIWFGMTLLHGFQGALKLMRTIINFTSKGKAINPVHDRPRRSIGVKEQSPTSQGSGPYNYHTYYLHNMHRSQRMPSSRSRDGTSALNSTIDTKITHTTKIKSSFHSKKFLQP